MKKTKYIETDANTVNLIELLMLELRRLNEKLDRQEILIREIALQSPTLSHYYTTKEVMDILKVSRKTVYNLRKSGKLNAREDYGQLRFLRSDIEKHIKGFVE